MDSAPAISNAGLYVCMKDDECGSQDGDRFKAQTDWMVATSTLSAWATVTSGPGPQFAVNTEQPFKIVTRFHAPAGVLESIEQFYVQNGQKIHQPNSPTAIPLLRKAA